MTTDSALTVEHEDEWLLGGMAFSLAVQNPFNGQTDVQYRCLLRASDVRFRRVLIFMRLSGCQTGELWRLRWGDVDWGRGCLVIHGKRRNGTPKLCTVPLDSVAVKLLRWLQRHPVVPLFLEKAIESIRTILSPGPLPAADFQRRCRTAGLPVKYIYKLAREAGADVWRVGTYPTCRAVWGLLEQMPDDVRSRQNTPRRQERVKYNRSRRLAQPDREHVFLDSFGQPWSKLSLNNRLQRAKRKAGLEDETEILRTVSSPGRWARAACARAWVVPVR